MTIDALAYEAQEELKLSFFEDQIDPSEMDVINVSNIISETNVDDIAFTLSFNNPTIAKKLHKEIAYWMAKGNL